MRDQFNNSLWPWVPGFELCCWQCYSTFPCRRSEPNLFETKKRRLELNEFTDIHRLQKTKNGKRLSDVYFSVNIYFGVLGFRVKFRRREEEKRRRCLYWLDVHSSTVHRGISFFLSGLQCIRLPVCLIFFAPFLISTPSLMSFCFSFAFTTTPIFHFVIISPIISAVGSCCCFSVTYCDKAKSNTKVNCFFCCVFLLFWKLLAIAEGHVHTQTLRRSSHAWLDILLFKDLDTLCLNTRYPRR